MSGYGTLGKLAEGKDIPGAPKHSWGKWPKVDPATVAPLRDGRPDMYHHQPTRFVSLAEAKARGWKHFWTGEICVTGHRAARYVANPSECVDCKRIEQGKLPVYGKGVPELEAARRRNYTQKNTQSLVGPPQPTTAEKRFLEKYAELKDFALAAEAVGRTEPEFLAILSWNTLFRESVNRLEESLGITRTQELTDEFDWTNDKRRSFLIMYANTADMTKSLRAVGATNVQFHKELTENDEFQREFDNAAQIARSVFDHAASAAAAKGDMKMLGRVAANYFPEKFGESLKMDLNVKQNLTLDQAHAQLASLLSGLDRQGLLTAGTSEVSAEGTAVDAEYEVVEPAADDESDRCTESALEDPGADPNSDLVSGPE
jgi:hypothetical protein